MAVFGQVCVGGLSGFEYAAILAGELRNPGKIIGRFDTGEFDSLLQHSDHGFHSAQDAGRARAGGQSNN
jgi:hypothetical protein